MTIQDFITYVQQSVVPAQMTSCFVFKNIILKVEMDGSIWTIYKPINNENSFFTHHEAIATLNIDTQVIAAINGNNEFESLFN